jgi:hypothetical protein
VCHSIACLVDCVVNLLFEDCIRALIEQVATLQDVENFTECWCHEALLDFTVHCSNGDVLCLNDISASAVFIFTINPVSAESSCCYLETFFSRRFLVKPLNMGDDFRIWGDLMNS